MSQNTEVSISCHCGAAKQTVALPRATTGEPLDVDLCHCSACRHSTGLLCASYAPIKRPGALGGLVGYRGGGEKQGRVLATPTAAVIRYFCETCGCHVFRSRTAATHAEDLEEGVAEWSVATGVIVGRVGASGEPVDGEGDEEPLLRFARHVGTASTRDGGLSSFIKAVEGPRELVVCEQSAADDHCDINDRDTCKGDSGVLNAHCHCKTIRLCVTRPDASSRVPRSGFSDMIAPFATSPRDVAANPHDEKWWLRPAGDPNPTQYLAGACACRSCRLISGFEIQTWAFVPQGNIFFLPPAPSPSPSSGIPSTAASSASSPSSVGIPLDFATLRQEGVPLKSYESSPGVLREFCPRCGAAVFWHDRWRPDLVDVSVGLFDAAEGARAETWLEWWCGRVSFDEEAERGRTGAVARMARCLVDSLAQGLRRWGEEEKLGGKRVEGRGAFGIGSASSASVSRVY
ncbi:hypothetical protein F4819DRAFT_248895 [Hypoxylon fuscum]|nr:hypothetical protein F4819DRAFT_248895 [Hypoxylon fuscum]